MAHATSSVMRIPPDAVIDETKFTHYLLAPRPWDDKSGYLRQAGFDLENWPDLIAAVRRLADTVDAVGDRTNDYGTFYRVEGVIEGPIGKLSVVCIWMKQAVDRKFRFVTLKPAKGRSGNVSTTV
ncbi:MAG TPA: hypothetical protein VNJ03_08760 [Vicinamibacterales bacterium]|nr:hypothetical protein [Vicinamibacterales bacterium]